NPTYQFLTWEFFHPDALAVAPLLFAYWAARSARWRWFVVATVLAMACKEDVALVVAGLGLLIWLRGDRGHGLRTALAGFGWFLLSTRLLMRRALGGLDPFYDAFFPELGGDALGVVRGALARPRRVFDIATRPDRISYYRMILAPFAFLPLAEPPTMALVAGPLLAVNALTSSPYARDYRYHYSALVVAGVTVATVEVIARLGRNPSARRFLVGLVAATALATSVAWGPSPIGVKYRSGIWPLVDDPRVAAKRHAVDLVPPNARVAAGYDLVPHLAHRVEIYQFPEPWTVFTWGIAGEGLPDPDRVEWLVLDRRHFLTEDDRSLAERLLSGSFQVRFERDGVVVAQRTRPG
ncbi:MAG: hypothetical protein QOE93_1716, partial [Actinomycetota bacterium]|nr:hypothetical protein [Actinomycetota bacterium]